MQPAWFQIDSVQIRIDYLWWHKPALPAKLLQNGSVRFDEGVLIEAFLFQMSYYSDYKCNIKKNNSISI